MQCVLDGYTVWYAKKQRNRNEITAIIKGKTTGLHLWGGAQQTFLNTQMALESLVKVVGRGEVGIIGYQSNIYAC